jgi:hypothetical protein
MLVEEKERKWLKQEGKEAPIQGSSMSEMRWTVLVEEKKSLCGAVVLWGRG